jgi:putative transposase
MLRCDGKSASALGAIPNQVRPFSTVNRLKAVLCVAMSAATTQQKKIQGRKRHLLVDTQGLLLGVKVLAADIRDRAGGQVLLTALVGSLPRLQVIWGDSGYAGEPFEQWVKDHLGVRFEIVKHPWTGLRGVWAPEGAIIDWDKIMPRGFHVLKWRWVVERTNAWITRHRRLSRDCEGTHSSSEAFIYLAMTRIMVSRLVRARG